MGGIPELPIKYHRMTLGIIGIPFGHEMDSVGCRSEKETRWPVLPAQL
jgi:hypothetical protein